MASQEQSRPVTLFYSYSHEDEALREALERHLHSLEDEGLLRSWHSRKIGAGEIFQHAIDKHLEQASFILLLVSSDFLASNKIEMQRALERQREGQARVIPVILRPCNWEAAPFGDLQVLPDNRQPITIWSNQDEAFLQISRSLRALLTTQSVSENKPTPTASQNRVNMLIKLQRLYDETLDDSLQKLAWMDLPLTSLPGAVQTTANLLLRRTNLPAQPLAPGTSIQQVYQQANQQLLILGEPGAGKSTLLYQIGRDRLSLAQQTTQPLPVVLPLASWAQKRLPLQEWMVEQLHSPLYEVPRRQSQQWVQDQQILPLLDGLDEVEEAARPACIAAINAFHKEFPLCPLVVCSRSQEYQAASQDERLHLYSAIEVQPLTTEQQEEALQQVGASAEALREELTSNAELRELARTPIWLNMLLVTARETVLPTLPQERATLQQEVLRRYVERQCERKGDVTTYPLAQTARWLGFLAHQMRQRSQVAFAIEELQPSWLSKTVRRAYHWSVGLIIGTLFGLLVGLLCELVLELLAGWLFGLLIPLIVGLPAGLLFGLIVALFFGRKGKVTLAERLRWSWKEVGGWLLIELVVGLLGKLLSELFIPLFVGQFVTLLVVREREQAVERHTSSPGKGISRSVKNGLFFGLLVGLFVALLFGLFLGLLFGLFFGLLFGLFVALFVGLGPALQHLMISFWLARTDRFPRRPLPFLDDACERALLKRVGGTYRFIHQLVLDYFADLEQLGDDNAVDLAPSQTVETGVQKQTMSDTP